MKGSKIADQAALVIARESIEEAVHQLATAQEDDNRGGVVVALNILQAVANVSGKQAREMIRQELAAYVIPFCALEIGSSEIGFSEEEELAQ